jgi:hypothetical protein
MGNGMEVSHKNPRLFGLAGDILTDFRVKYGICPSILLTLSYSAW